MDGLKLLLLRSTVSAGGAMGHLPEAAPAPLAMPAQDLSQGRLAPPPATAPADMGLRRLFVFGSAAGLGAIGSFIMFDALKWHGFQPLEALFLVLFSFLFTWMAFAFVSYCVGLWALACERDDLDLYSRGPLPDLACRTAVLVPVCNEDPVGVARRIDIMRQSLIATQRAAHFDIFVLSDTRDLGASALERAVLQALPAAGPEVHYRRRPENIDRKSGNVADWVRKHGAAFDHMVVLDADSLMSGDTLVRLAGAMERHAGVGLIQTIPRLIGQSSLFARCEQFAARLYGPAAAAGMAWWSGAESNFWGHNAIIRTRAFAEAAGLPHLDGPAPFGGLIMSHDFVEAALLRRAGWAVHMAPRLDGSYEECPPTVLDMLARDRRWCQGNLQHAAVVPTKGLHWINRFHLVRGILNYLIAPIWCAMMITGALMASTRATIDDCDALVMAAMFAVTIGFLVGPRLVACAVALRDEWLDRAYGGRWGAGISIAAEMTMSTLMTPLIMVSHTLMVLSVVLGFKSGWKTQNRAAYALSLGHAARRFLPHMALGGLLFAAMAWMSPEVRPLVAITALSLLASAPLAVVTAMETPDELRTVFRTPEEYAVRLPPAPRPLLMQSLKRLVPAAVKKRLKALQQS
ncbi:glucans biosynthesis glucosyltransferase MdoH [Asticcacaulis solisilvae]|uniref:glucans biosynthesis glucosyltransferase MdoH n=1 Tax=Asticcacaulis solisilvae TaxID=1217274 RepID=UPI003FD8237A